MRSKRFEILDARPVNQDGYVSEWPEVGLIAMDGPNDPKPSIRIENGEIVELDGRQRADFDMLDTFIASYGINLERAVEANAIDSVRLAHMLCDINIPRHELIPLTTALTPAKAAEVVSRMSVLEMMAAVTKLRARKRPAMQGHVTSVTDNPVQLAADAAEAGIRGFAEEETTVGIVRYAPLNALAVLVGSQTGRPGNPYSHVRGGGSHRTPARDARAHVLRGDGLGLRHRSGSSWMATTPRGRRRSWLPATPPVA